MRLGAFLSLISVFILASCQTSAQKKESYYDTYYRPEGGSVPTKAK